MVGNAFYALFKKRTLIAFFLLFSVSLVAEEPGQVEKKANLNWNIAASDNSSDRMSEIEYRKPGVADTDVDMKAIIHKIYSRASISFGKTVEDDCLDPDYTKDTRDDFDAQSKTEIYNDIHALCIGLGYQFDVNNKKNIKISPLAGLSYQAHNLRPKKVVQAVSSGMNFSSKGKVLPGLESTYAVEWKSWFLGVDFVYEAFKNFYLSSTVEYHNAQYATEAESGQSDDFGHPVGFIQEAEGTGSKINIGINRLFAQRWLVGLLYDWQQWSTASGNDILYWWEGSEKSKFSEGNWGCQTINLSIGYNF